MLTFGSLTLGFRVWGLGFRVQGLGSDLPLVSREWRNGVQLSLLLLPFFHSLLTKGRNGVPVRAQGLEFRVWG